MTIALRHEWLQKEATPGTAEGDFRWYPAAGDRDLRAAMTGVADDGGRAAWRIEPGRVAWAVSFTSVPASDRRRYVGLALTVAEGDAPASALLAAIDVLPAEPWRAREADAGAARATDREVAAATMTPYTPAPRAVDPATAGTLARVLWSGGAATIAAPADPALPGLCATLATWLPDDVAGRTRQGTFAPAADRAADPAPPPLHHYLGLSWALPTAIAADDADLGRRAWCAACGLAARAAVAPEEMFDELAALARAWTTTEELAALLDRSGTVRADEQRACDRRAPAPLSAARDAGWLWARVVHYWGRGFLRGDELEARLGRLLARRVVADHLFHLDAPAQRALPMRYLHRLRREAIVPRAKVAALLAQVAAEIPEVLHG
jgi:hypothetical protein